MYVDSYLICTAHKFDKQVMNDFFLNFLVTHQFRKKKNNSPIVTLLMHINLLAGKMKRRENLHLNLLNITVIQKNGGAWRIHSLTLTH